MKNLLLVLLVCSCCLCSSQTETAPTTTESESPYAERDFLIIASTKNINEAYTLAKKAAQRTGLKFRDNALQKDTLIGATFPVDTCKSAGFEFPCYIARGRYDDGTYISVEYSNAYDGFKKGLFIVIAANGFKQNDEFKSAVTKIKKLYPKSYVKRTKVYLGCMH